MAKIDVLMDEGCVRITGYSSLGVNSGENHLYSKPNLVKLTSNYLEVEAEWWSTSFDKFGKVTRKEAHKVLITAKF